MDKINLGATLSGMMLVAACGLARADGRCDLQDIIDLGAGATGTAKVCVNSNGINGKFRAQDLVQGNAYTVWWMYFDDPTLCTHGPEAGTCGEGDLAPSDAGGGTPLGVFGRFGSAVAPRNGKVYVSDSWSGMQPSSGAVIWLMMLDHGPANLADGRHLARQLLTPEDPMAGMPHLGNDVDGPGFVPVALTVHGVE